MIYADYAYYIGTFYGDQFDDPDEFVRCAARASEYIDRITMNRAQDYVILHPDNEAVKKACCALAEQYHQIRTAKETAMTADGAIASESVGNHSVSYRSGTETAAVLEADLRKIAASYLSMTGLLYRGIPNVHASYCYTD